MMFLAAFIIQCATTIVPPIMSDEELVRSKVIVVARWDQSPLVPHNLVEAGTLKNIEAKTRIEVTQVIKGNIGLGNHDIVLGPFIGWNKNGGPIIVSTATYVHCGDVCDVKGRNLWFLDRRRSWDANDPNVYLYVGTYRDVQPAALLPYFQALNSKNPRQTVPALLSSSEPMVATRCLRYIAGGIFPWPYQGENSDFGARSERRLTPLFDEAIHVENLLSRTGDVQVRRYAASVFAELAGKKAIPRVRQLLDSDDPYLAAIAIGILACYHDNQSIQKIGQTAARVAGRIGSFRLAEPNGQGDLKESQCGDALSTGHEYRIGVKVVEALSQWNTCQIAPSLMSFLQNDTFSYRIADDIGIPAFKAQIALRELTGYTFPMDVQASQRAWASAEKIRDPKERRRYLARILDYDPEPLTARLFREGNAYYIRLTNKSRWPVDLTRCPVEVSSAWSSNYPPRFHVTGRDSFLSVKPGQTICFKIDFDRTFASADPRKQVLTLLYARNGNEYGLNAWMGLVKAVPKESEQTRPSPTVEQRNETKEISKKRS